MKDKDFCLSSYIAFRYIWKDDMDFYTGFHHRNYQPVADADKIPVVTSAGIDREIRKQVDALYEKHEHIGILLRFGAPVIDRLRCTAILAFAVFPSVGQIGVQHIPVFGIEMGDTVFAIGIFGTIKRAARQVGCQLRDCQAENLFVQYVVYAFLTIRNNVR